MPRFTFSRDFYIPKGANVVEVRDPDSDAVAYKYEVAGAPCAKVFFGKQAAPVADFKYRDDARRDASIADWFARRRQHNASMRDRRETRKAFQHNVRKGDMYRTSWGYDQTNVEFFEVVEVKGKFAILREVTCAVDQRDGDPSSEYLVPQSGSYREPRHEKDDRGQPIRRLIQEGHIKIDDVRTAWPWGKRDETTGTVIGCPVRQTALGWGH